MAAVDRNFDEVGISAFHSCVVVGSMAVSF
jgi:hypothetical protein